MKIVEKKVLITGGARSLSKAIAQGFLTEGASVAVNDKDAGAVAQFEQESAGKPILAFTADITDYEMIEKVAAKVWGE